MRTRTFARKTKADEYKEVKDYDMIVSPVLTVMVLSISELDNDILAAANNGINGFGNIGKGNQAFKPMRNLGLIDDSGKAIDDELSEALTFEVNKRVQAGKFN